MQYATSADLARFLDPDAADPPVPPKAGVLVREASQVVSDALRLVRYAVDAEGLPSSVRQREAVRDATCAQAAAWLAAGIDPLQVGGAQDALGGRRVSSKSAGGLSVSYVASPAADAARDALVAGELVPSAWRYLTAAGLVRGTAVDIGTYVGVGTGYVEAIYDPLTGELEP